MSYLEIIPDSDALLESKKVDEVQGLMIVDDDIVEDKLNESFVKGEGDLEWPDIELRPLPIRRSEFKNAVNKLSKDPNVIDAYIDSNGKSIFDFVKFEYRKLDEEEEFGETFSTLDSENKWAGKNESIDQNILDENNEYISGPSNGMIVVAINNNWDWKDEPELLDSTILHELVHAWIYHQIPMYTNIEYDDVDPHKFEEWTEKCKDVFDATGIDPDWDTYIYTDYDGKLWGTLDPARHPHPDPKWKYHETQSSKIEGSVQGLKKNESIEIGEESTLFEAEDGKEGNNGELLAQTLLIWIIQQCLMYAFQCEFAAAPGQDTFKIQNDNEIQKKYDRLVKILDAVDTEKESELKQLIDGKSGGSAQENAKFAQALIKACPKEHGDEIKEILQDFKDYLGNQVAAFKLN